MSNGIDHADENGTAEVIDELAQDMQSLEVKVDDQSSTPPSPSVSPENKNDIHDNGTGYFQSQHNFPYEDPEPQLQHIRNYQQHQFYEQENASPLPSYHFNKRQTGKKNLSSIILGTDDKIEFDQSDHNYGYGVVKINRPIGTRSRSSTDEHLNDNESVHSHDSARTHTDQGYFDLKYYSQKLW